MFLFARLELTRLYPYSNYNVEIQALDAYKAVLGTYKVQHYSSFFTRGR